MTDSAEKKNRFLASAKVVWRVLQYARPYWQLASISGVLIFLSAGAALLQPWPLQILIDNVLENKPLAPILASLLGRLAEDRLYLLFFAVGSQLGVHLLLNGLKVASSYVDTRIEQHIVLDFRSDLFQHAQKLSLAYHDRKGGGAKVFAINFQARSAAGLVMTVPTLAKNVLMVIGMVWIIFWIDSTLALLALTIVPFLYYSIGYYTSRIEDRVRKVRNMEGQTLSIINEAMSMLRVIVAFGRESYEYTRFRQQGERALDARVGLTIRQTIFSLVVNMMTVICTAAVLGFGAYRVLQDQLTVGQLLVVMAYIGFVYGPLQAISGAAGSIHEQLVKLAISFDLLDTVPDIQDAPDAIPLATAKGHVVFQNVHFNYAGRSDTLRNLSFEAQPGQVVGIVGPTGAGKTTLVSMIPRFYDPGEGRILLDSKDVRKLTLKSLRGHISIVHQEPLLFSGSIADNIRYGRLEAGEDEIVQAAKDAKIHDFVFQLPKQYATEVGERGVQLSGGERQRISVARAFLKNAPILILDEPTSAVDTKTEAVILEALERLMAGRTTFIVAHRLSTLRNADLILVLDRGELVEQGTHDELLTREGLYWQLHAVQTKRKPARELKERVPQPHTAAGG